MWEFLRNKKLGVRFWRQYSVGPYILDFYAPRVRLAVELDGDQHADATEKLYDSDRDSYLLALDIKTIRFWNKEVIENVENVIKQISQHFSQPPLVSKRG